VESQTVHSAPIADEVATGVFNAVAFATLGLAVEATGRLGVIELATGTGVTDGLVPDAEFEGAAVSGTIVTDELSEGAVVSGELVTDIVSEGAVVVGELVVGELVMGELSRGAVVTGEGLVTGEADNGAVVTGERVMGIGIEGALVTGEGLVAGAVVNGTAGSGAGAGTESSPLMDVTRIVGGVPSAVPSAVTTPVTLARNPCRCVPAPVHVLQIPTSRAASMSIILPASSTRKSLV
jgi:hypothetical protein